MQRKNSLLKRSARNFPGELMTTDEIKKKLIEKRDKIDIAISELEGLEEERIDWNEVFIQLPEQFQISYLIEAVHKLGFSVTNPSLAIGRWINGKKIQRIKRGTYQKIHS